MENCVIYIKLFILAVASLITGVSTISRKWYINFFVFLLCIIVETCLAYLFFPAYVFYPACASLVIFVLSWLWERGKPKSPGENNNPIRLPVQSGISKNYLEFYYYYSNFLIYGGAGSGKTKSIGKWLLEEYIRLGFAGFIYDFKDIDYTRTAYNLIEKHGYPHKFYYVSFDRPVRSYRFNPLKVVKDRTELLQLMEDILLALLPKKEQQNEWVAGGLGILRGVAFRFWDEFPEYCTLPHIMAFIMTASSRQLSMFLQQNLVSEMMAGAYLKAEGSEKTQASYLSTLCNNLATISQNEEIAYIRQTTGKEPKLRGFELLAYSPNINYADASPECLKEVEENKGTVETALQWARANRPDKVNDTGTENSTDYTTGGILTFSFHWFSPLGGRDKSFYTENTDFDAAKILQEGTPERAAFYHDMDVIAGILQQFQQEHIPILWRPFHESYGTWFWWGAKGAKVARDLYRLMFNYYTGEKNLHNLLWVWNCDIEEAYPGDEYVDVVSIDVYLPEYTSRDKVAALAEVGYLPDVELLQKSRIPWAYYMTWSKEFCIGEKYNRVENLKKMYDSEYAVTL